MRILIHIGLHKTATTLLQTMLREAHVQLQERGIWFEPIQWYPAHHELAWQLLRGDFGGLGNLVSNAKRNACHTIILSSEDLESLVIKSDIARSIEDFLRNIGVNRIEWHASVRKPDEYFWSLISETANHTYVDTLQIFFHILKDGYVLVNGPPDWNEHAAPFWYHCFDYFTLFGKFSSNVTGALILHDYHASAVFPGSTITQKLGLNDLLIDPNSPEARNARQSNAVKEARHVDRFVKIAGDDFRNFAEVLVRRNQNFTGDQRQKMSNRIYELFERSRSEALKKFGINTIAQHGDRTKLSSEPSLDAN